jgi:hypothetical protein
MKTKPADTHKDISVSALILDVTQASVPKYLSEGEVFPADLVE